MIDLVKKSAERLREKGAVTEEISVPWHLDGKWRLQNNFDTFYAYETKPSL